MFAKEYAKRHSKWSTTKKIEVVMEIIKKTHTITDLSYQHNIPVHQIRKWLHEFSGGLDISLDYDMIMCKDKNLCVVDCNESSGLLGEKCPAKEGKGKTDGYAWKKEKTDLFRSLNEICLSKNAIQSCTVNVQIYNFLSVPIVNYNIPIKDENGEIAGLAIISRPTWNFLSVPFGQVYALINKGLANFLITKKQYVCKHFDVEYIFSAKEIELFLYLLIGKTAKEIAIFLNLSHRSIEQYIAVIKEKIGVSTTSMVLDFFENSDIFNQLESIHKE